MTVKELIELLYSQPGDYEVAVRTIDDHIREIRDDAVTDLAEFDTPDDHDAAAALRGRSARARYRQAAGKPARRRRDQSSHGRL